VAIPDYQTAMLPLLDFAGKSGPAPIREAVEALADAFKLTDAERVRLKPSGRQPLFHNRVHWAKFYLAKAGLLSQKRGVVEITSAGQDVLRRPPSRIDLEYLRRYPSFVEFIAAKTSDEKSSAEATGGLIAAETPEDMIARGHRSLTRALQDQLLERVLEKDFEFFEELVVELLVKMGYGGNRDDAGQALGRSHDQGVDGIINQDRLGLDVIYIQAKRWDRKRAVGSPDVDRFIGALHKKHASKGVFLTTSYFTDEARDAVRGIAMKVVPIDGLELTQLMIEHDLGVTTEHTYAIKRVDSDYFE
jgi:restriction system protein